MNKQNISIIGNAEISNIQIGNGNVMINDKTIFRKKQTVICSYCGRIKKNISEICLGCGATK